MTVIDSHQHFWQLGRFDYAWLTPELKAIYRDFRPADLLPLMQAAGVERSVLVQADASIAETGWMLALCDQHPHIAGVVGWVDLASQNLAEELEQLVHHPHLKGVRPDLPPLGSDWSRLDAGLSLLVEHHLTCDLLVRPEIYPGVFEIAVRHPGVVFVLDHLAGVKVKPAGHQDWIAALLPLARLSNVVMKLSGYLTAASGRLTAEILQPYIDNALELFGVERLMFGSDWPVCTLGGAYGRAVKLLSITTASLAENESAALWGGTAQRVYRLSRD